MSAEEKVFADGFLFKRNEKAPEFVVGSMSIKVDDAIAFLKANEKRGWVNVQIKQARSGKYYVELDTFEPSAKGSQGGSAPAPASKPKGETATTVDDELPF